MATHRGQRDAGRGQLFSGGHQQVARCKVFPGLAHMPTGNEVQRGGQVDDVTLCPHVFLHDDGVGPLWQSGTGEDADGLTGADLARPGRAGAGFGMVQQAALALHHVLQGVHLLLAALALLGALSAKAWTLASKAAVSSGGACPASAVVSVMRRSSPEHSSAGLNASLTPSV